MSTAECSHSAQALLAKITELHVSLIGITSDRVSGPYLRSSSLSQCEPWRLHFPLYDATTKFNSKHFMGRLPAPVHLTAMDAVLCECALVRLRSDSVWRASFMESALTYRDGYQMPRM